MKESKNLTILGIETSCDDTAVAVIKASKKSGFEVLSNIVSSQIKIHKKYGGVYPMLAKRAHQENLPHVLIEALEKAGLSKNLKPEIHWTPAGELPEGLYPKQILNSKFQIPNINLIAVTVGPGLEPCLWVGINFAKELAKKWNKPLIPVNHIESHILVNFLDSKTKNIFPAVCLVVSGGHTQIILMKDINKYKILGETRDDAAGECFDKTAKILGLGYPGGPAIAKLASQFPKIQNTKYKIHLPRPMINTKDYDFSFSGLKTAVLYTRQKLKAQIIHDRKLFQSWKTEMAAEIQQAIIDVLMKKTIKAAKDYRAKSIILGGGVSTNDELRKQFIENCLPVIAFGDSRWQAGKLKIENCDFLVPPKNLSTDNAVMTAITGYFQQKKKIALSDRAILKAKANLRIGKT